MKSWRNPVLASAAAVLAIPFGAWAGEEAKPETGPRIVVEQEVVDAGQVVRGNPVSATFVIKNEGTEPLKLVNVKPGCGCTVASFDETIAPGETGNVSATVKTENFRGNIEKAIAVTSNDATKGTLNLRVRAQVVGSIDFVPRPGLAFPAGSGWEWSSKLIVRKDPTETGALAISDVTANVPWLTAKATPVKEMMPAAEGLPEAQPGDWILDVTVSDDAPRTRGGFQVKFKTGLAREPEAMLPVSVVLEQPLRAVPNAVDMRSGRVGDGGGRATIEAVLRPGLKGSVVTATASPEPFAVKIESADEKKIRATVTWNPAAEVFEASPRNGSVIFRVGEDSVTVPIHVYPDVPSRQAKAKADAAAAAQSASH